MLYVVAHNTRGDVFETGYSWSESLAEDMARADRDALSRSDLAHTETAVLGYDVPFENDAKAAYERMVEHDLEVLGFVRDCNYYEEIS